MATNSHAFAQPWLALQCQMIAGVSRGVVALGEPGQGPYKPAALWPEGAAATRGLEQAARIALSEGRAVSDLGGEGEGGRPVLAIPLRVRGALVGVAAVELDPAAKTPPRVALQLLRWSCACLELMLGAPASAAETTPASEPHHDLVAVLDLVATTVSHERYPAAATAFVTELASRFGCERVSLGFLKGRRSQVSALSHSARFGRKSNLIRALGAAMDEALDQHASVVHPGPRSGQLTRAHAELAEHHGAGGVCSIPLRIGDRLLGALTLERAAGASFDSQTVALCEHIASLAGPLLELKRRDDRWWIQKTRDSVRGQLARLFGPRHATAKLVALSLVALVVFLAFARGEHRVSASARLEGSVQRVVVAAMDGYVATAQARAGDIVREGDRLGSLEDRELTLERTRWVGQRQQLRKEYRAALAGHDRSGVNVLRAQLSQAEAQIELLDQQLARTALMAPFDGIVVTGDLSQSLGSPVARGDVLFEVAPLDAYRVILQVDEREITDVAVGQRGTLALSAMPGERLPLFVEKITPVSSADDGRNFFRVEARLEAASELLRPGMEGVGKIAIGPRRLLWIWTHELGDWLRLQLWSWWP